MSRREQLENEVERARKRLDNAPEDTPVEVLKQWRREYDELAFDLNNLYDDNEMEYPD